MTTKLPKAKNKWTIKITLKTDGFYLVDRSCMKGLDVRDVYPEMVEVLREAVQEYDKSKSPTT